ncbi:MAG: hypothetical protein EA404_09120 [Spirochaetaceae bacterium]|nr:MAG: hypothetical protein EA404_09120 [Spirochaetaceae bacterium]
MTRRRLCLVVAVAGLVSLSGAAQAEAQTAYGFSLGGNFFRYDEFFLATGATVLIETAEQMEVQIGADFAIRTTRDDDGDIVPRILLPATLGMNFLFPGETITGLFGAGVTPTFLFRTDKSDSRFLMGPYAKAGVRAEVHAVMSWFLEIQQDLLFGGPDWINTATRIQTGIVYRP